MACRLVEQDVRGFLCEETGQPDALALAIREGLQPALGTRSGERTLERMRTSAGNCLASCSRRGGPGVKQETPAHRNWTRVVRTAPERAYASLSKSYG